MIKKLLLIVITLTSISGALAVNQSSRWRIHATFDRSRIQNIVDTKDKVYYLATNNLFRLDKATLENEALNKINYLNDVDISEIYYNRFKDYLLITYSNSNIDVILKDGSVINLPDIDNSSMSSSKKINDVTFSSNGFVYVATDFGYVVINDSKWEVRESRMFNTPLRSVAAVGKNIYLSKDNMLYYGALDKHYQLLTDYNIVSSTNDNARLRPIDDTKFLALTGWSFLYSVSIGNDGALSFSPSVLTYEKTNNLQATPTGYIGNCYDAGHYYTIDAEGRNLQVFDTDEMLSSYHGGDGTVWALGKKGLHKATGAGSDSYYVPNASNILRPFYLTYNQAEKRLYVSSTGTNALISWEYDPACINVYDGHSWLDVTPDYEFVNGGTYCPKFSTVEASTYFLNNWWNGVYKVTNQKVVAGYGRENSPLNSSSDWSNYATIEIDRSGNLWAIPLNVKNKMYVLPRSKQSLSSVALNDWIGVDMPNAIGSKRGKFTVLKHSDMKIYADGDYKGSLIFFNDEGKPSSSVSSKTYSNGTLIDQDNLQIEWLNLNAFVEDNAGNVWVGTDRGVFAFNPDNALTANFTVNHIKVPRNDGTNLADYLLNNIPVTCIAVDAANRKWIGTQGSGLFLVNADGSSILQQFNTSNSPLLSNNIYDVCCIPNSNSVFITAEKGIMEYFSDTMPADGNLSNIHAYPNPVRPEYMGNVTIEGLMDNSLVKIADASGNVLRQLKSSGSTASWDCCNDSGERVKSGVYFIFASQAGGNSSQAAVTKVLVIR